MPSCSSCGATSPIGTQVCDYCGVFLDTETGVVEPVAAGLVDEAWKALQQLRDMGIPQAKDILLQMLWWNLVIMTLGVVALFWKRPRPRCSGSGHRAAMDNLLFLTRAAMPGLGKADVAKIQFIEQEASRLAAEVQIAKKRNRWVVAAVVVAVVVLALIGQGMEDKDRSTDQTTSHSTK